jgi:hypothetical protein
VCSNRRERLSQKKKKEMKHSGIRYSSLCLCTVLYSFLYAGQPKKNNNNNNPVPIMHHEVMNNEHLKYKSASLRDQRTKNNSRSDA